MIGMSVLLCLWEVVLMWTPYEIRQFFPITIREVSPAKRKPPLT
jgi:hypothetical protein